MAVVEDMKKVEGSQEDKIIMEEPVVMMVLQDKMEKVMRGQVQ